MKFEMTPAEMLEFHSLLEKRHSKARTVKEKDFLEKQMDAVYLVLSAALQFTIGSNVENIAKALMSSEIDKDLLSLVVGPDRVKAISMVAQQEIEFTTVETIEERVTKENYKQYPLKKQLDFLVSHSFTRNIAEAVDLFNEMNKSKLTNAKSWIAIRESYKNHEPFELWDKFITDSLVNYGAVRTFLSIKKHLKDWDDMDIAIIMNDAIERKLAKAPEGRVEQVRGILTDKYNTKKYWIDDAPTMECLGKIENISDHKAACQRVDAIMKYCNPIKREVLLKRKEYAEKGYN